MVKYCEQLDRTFAALADPTRREMLARLAKGEMPVTELAQPFDMSLPAVSKHLRVLKRAGLLRQQRDGRVRLCRLQAAPMKEAARWLAHYQQFWADQLDQLAEFVEGSEITKAASKRPTRKKSERSLQNKRKKTRRKQKKRRSS